MQKTIKILILEDRINDALLAQREIEKAVPDSEFLVVEDDISFQEALQNFKPDVIISDYDLPTYNGLSALKLANKVTPDTPFIIFTGSQNEDIAVDCMKTGAVDYIIKEYMKRLGAAVVNALEQKRIKQEKAEAELHIVESEKKYRKIFENILDAYFEMDFYGNLLEVSPSILGVSQYTREELIGKNIGDFFSNIEDLSALFKEYVHKGFVSEYEIDLKDKDGRIVPVAFTSKLTERPLRKTTKIIGMMRDISERKAFTEQLIAAKEKAEEMNRLKSYFLANMSHELRTPLSGILGFSELLENSVQEPESKEMAQLISKSGKRLLTTLDQILNLSRIEADKLHIAKEKVNLSQFLQDSVKLFTANAILKNIALDFIPCDREVFLETDIRLLEQIVNGIIDNAVKFTNEGCVEVTYEICKHNNKDCVEIKISDTGIGIPEQTRDTIFEPFRQASEGYSRSFEGVGLGLTLVKKYTDLLGGDISFVSSEGEGTTFFIKLLCSFCTKEKATEAMVKEIIEEKVIRNEEEHGHINVLLIDDDIITHKIVKHMLGDKYNLEYSNNPQDALRLMEQKQYQIILLDINLKDRLSGVDVLHKLRIRPEYKKTPVVAITAYAMSGDKEDFLKEGCTHYLSKPFRKEELLGLLQSIV